jgi:hypothetical protein
MTASVRVFVAMLVMTLTATGPLLAQTAAPPKLVLECVRRSPLALRLFLQNVGPEPTAVVIGGVLGNDRKYLFASLAFDLHRTGAPDVTVPYDGPDWPIRIGGRLDEWLVALPPDSEISLALPMRDDARRRFSEPVTVSARLLAQPHTENSQDLAGLRFVRIWTGTLTSEPVRIPQSCPSSG